MALAEHLPLKISLKDIQTPVQTDLSALDAFIRQALHSSVDLIGELCEHIISGGGKRLRPLITLLCAKAAGYQGDLHVELAAIIEMIHTATLLHDDVVDNADTRRGKASANAVWGNSASVLVGDFLYSRSFRLIVGLGSMEVLQVLADATSLIAEGEIQQLLNCGEPDTSEANYLKVIDGKTATLFLAAAKASAALAKASPEESEALATYARYLGLAFQLVDDALDYCGEAAALGKSTLADLKEGKPTLPLIYAMQQACDADREFIREAIRKAEVQDPTRIYKVIESTQAITYTYQLAQTYVEKAVASIAVLSDSPYRTALINLAHFSLTRNH